MGIFDIFKTQWSADKMTQDDRKKLFWYIKRRSSYTAWKREADAFDAFAVIYKKQMLEEPIGEGMMGETEWEFLYPQILRAQVLYEKALARLRQGDRSVWLYNSVGLCGDARAYSNNWYSYLMANGPRGDNFFYGKYIEELKEAVEVFDTALGDAGYQQSMMADKPAAHFWGELMDCLLKNEAFPRYPRAGEDRLKYASLLKYPTPLPEVPVPEKEILVHTGQNTPVFGIYEPQTKDGCMNYLLKDTPAPTLGLNNPESVTWRLIWEDTRYLDGIIPEEEALYFPPEEKIIPEKAIISPELYSTRPGEVCPKSGIWINSTKNFHWERFEKGDIFPCTPECYGNWLWSVTNKDN